MTNQELEDLRGMRGGHRMTYEIRDEGGSDPLSATTPEVAVREARQLLRSVEIEDNTRTVWLHAEVFIRGQDEDGEDDELIAHLCERIDPVEPACDGPDHDWREIQVQGHGGGVIVTDRCRYCDAIRETDTWAQDSYTGEQGLCSVYYPNQREETE